MASGGQVSSLTVSWCKPCHRESRPWAVRCGSQPARTLALYVRVCLEGPLLIFALFLCCVLHLVSVIVSDLFCPIYSVRRVPAPNIFDQTMPPKDSHALLKRLHSEVDASTSRQNDTEELSELSAGVKDLTAQVSKLSKRFENIGSMEERMALLEANLASTLELVEKLVTAKGEVCCSPLRSMVATGTQTPSKPTYRDVVTNNVHAHSGCANSSNSGSHARSHGARSPVRRGILTVKECMTSIDVFYGNSDKKADVVDASELIRFNAWFDAAQWKLSAACLSERQQVAVICQRLQGPMLAAYMLHIKHLDDPACMSDLKVQLQALFADSAVQFTDKALEMKFSAKSLVADIKSFQTYIRNSSLASSVDQNEFVYTKLRQKMTAVRANILMHAASEYQLQLDHAASFDVYVQQALNIAHRVQASPKREASPLRQAPPDKRVKAAADKSPKSKFQRMADLTEADLLKQWFRCPKCGWVMEGGVHSKGHVCDPAALSGRVQGLRRDLRNNKNPNRNVRISEKVSK